EPTIIPLVAMAVPIFTIVGGAAVLIVAIMMANRAARMRQETIQLAIKEGRELPPELFMRMRRPRVDRDPLLGGLVLTAVGLGVAIALGVAVAPVHAVWGLIPLLVGVALLVYVPFWRKQKKEEEEKL
nr:hypothetical protein [candidate division Zixibacteria bacterium]